MLTPFRPPPGSSGEQFYDILSAIATSLQVQYLLINQLIDWWQINDWLLFQQGLCVALLFCFCNGEVVVVVKKFVEDTCLNYPCLGFLSTTSRTNCYHSPLNNHTMASTLGHSPKNLTPKDGHRSNDSSGNSNCIKSNVVTQCTSTTTSLAITPLNHHRNNNHNHNNLNENQFKLGNNQVKMKEERLMMEERGSFVINQV